MIKNLLTTKQKQQRTPAWFMRQAGRYLPEYMQIKNTIETKGGGFFEMCDDAKIATEITLQPIKRFNIDAAIVFSDILIVPRALSWKVEMLPKTGPKLDQFINLDDVEKLNINEELLGRTPQAIKMIKSQSSLDLIGFAGAPFTVAMYMLTGGKIDGNKDAKKMLYKEDLLDVLLPIIVETTKVYLSIQIEAGADIIKIFESHCGLLNGNDEFIDKYHIKPVQNIVNFLKNRYPQTPIILFPRGAGEHYEEIASKINVDCIAIDETVGKIGVEKLKKTGKVLQGNLDNYLVCYGTKKQIEYGVDKVLNLMGDYPFIFNLGHGILQHTNPDNINIILDKIK